MNTAKWRSGEEIRKSFISMFKNLCSRFDAASVWSDTMFLLGCSISNSVDFRHFEQREKAWLDTIAKYNPKEQALYPLLYQELVSALDKNPGQDFLGEVYTHLGINTHSGGKYFTPHQVSMLMSLCCIDHLYSATIEHGYSSLNDTACGSGSTLIATIQSAALLFSNKGLNWQNHILVAAQDINLTAALMCYIQLSLLGAAGYVKVGDALSDPMTNDDSPEKYWFTPMYFSDVWRGRRIFTDAFLLRPQSNIKGDI